MCYKGIHVEQSYKEAALYWKRGAEEDNADCAYYLAALYLAGKGVEQSKEKAIYWLDKASKLGHEKASELLKDIKED